MQHTSLYDLHQNAGAQLVDFFGWSMPLHYGSQLEEHLAVRQSLGLFDISHMGIVDISGINSARFLRYLLANDVHKLKTSGSALYTCMLNEQGGVIDDLIVYRLQENEYRLVINAATRQKDFAWMKKYCEYPDINFKLRDDLAMLALQGPETMTRIQSFWPLDICKKVSALRPFKFMIADNILIARTGYTGEDGIEIILSAAKAENFWKKCMTHNIQLCGLGARDTLRLEAGLNLYGTDMNETTSPLISNLAWTVAWDDPNRDFMGRAALEEQIHQGLSQQLIGIVMREPGVLRNHQSLYFEKEIQGEITSGSYSPTLGHAIGLARVPNEINSIPYIERRGKQIAVELVKPPFVKFGKKVYSPLTQKTFI